MKYKIVETMYHPDLEKKVNEFIEDGWEPIGGVSVTGNFHSVLIYCQAMILNDELETLQEENNFNN